MLVKHLTQFMNVQLQPENVHKIYVVKNVTVRNENNRDVRYYDIGEASLKDKIKMNIPTAAGLKARGEANIELAKALEDMRQEEQAAIQNAEIKGGKNFIKMGVEYLWRRHFNNMDVAPDARATKLTGIDFQHMSEEQWLRFEKLEKFLHFVQKNRHVPGNLGDNTSIAGQSTASGQENWAEAVQNNEPWRLFVIRNRDQHVFTERQSYGKTFISIHPETLQVLSQVERPGIFLDLEEIVPETEQRKGRRNALSSDEIKLKVLEKKRAVLDLEDAALRTKYAPENLRYNAPEPSALSKSKSEDSPVQKRRAPVETVNAVDHLKKVNGWLAQEIQDLKKARSHEELKKTTVTLFPDTEDDKVTTFDAAVTYAAIDWSAKTSTAAPLPQKLPAEEKVAYAEVKTAEDDIYDDVIIPGKQEPEVPGYETVKSDSPHRIASIDEASEPPPVPKKPGSPKFKVETLYPVVENNVLKALVTQEPTEEPPTPPVEVAPKEKRTPPPLPPKVAPPKPPRGQI